ncbi:hypothetical protein ACOJIV_24370 [Haloarcula sp. AONF1]
MRLSLRCLISGVEPSWSDYEGSAERFGEKREPGVGRGGETDGIRDADDVDLAKYEEATRGADRDIELETESERPGSRSVGERRISDEGRRRSGPPALGVDRPEEADGDRAAETAGDQ